MTRRWRKPDSNLRFPDRSEELEPLGAPAFQGEHNGTVFSELGLSENEIDSYVASGALVSVSIPSAVTNQRNEP